MAAWSSYTMYQDGQTDWLVHLYEKTINGVRYLGEIPYEDDGVMLIELPTMRQQALTMRYRPQMPPGHNVPSGVL